MKHRCPDEETLAAYFEWLLPPEEESALHAELRACPDCARLVAALGLVIEEEAPDAWQSARVPAAVTRSAIDLWAAAPDPVERALRLAVRWVGDRLAPLADALAPAPQAALAVRGAAPAVDAPREELRYEVQVGELPLVLDLEVEDAHQIALTVRPTAPPPAGLLVRLSRGDATCALSSLGAEGTTVPALPAGSYQLSLEQGDRALGTLQLDLGGG